MQGAALAQKIDIFLAGSPGVWYRFSEAGESSLFFLWVLATDEPGT
jgi:hypothetical protein